MSWVTSPWSAVNGMSVPVRFRLNDANGPIALSGYTPDAIANGIVMHLRDGNGNVLDTVGKLTVLDDGVDADLLGVVQFDPDDDDFASGASGYTVRFELLNNTGESDFVPRTEHPDTIVVGLVT